MFPELFLFHSHIIIKLILLWQAEVFGFWLFSCRTRKLWLGGNVDFIKRNLAFSKKIPYNLHRLKKYYYSITCSSNAQCAPFMKYEWMSSVLILWIVKTCVTSKVLEGYFIQSVKKCCWCSSKSFAFFPLILLFT